MDKKIAVLFDNFMSCNITSHCVLVKTKVKYQEEKNCYYICTGALECRNLGGDKHSPFTKVENIQEDSLDSFPSPLPSVKIQIIGGKVYVS